MNLPGFFHNIQKGEMVIAKTNCTIARNLTIFVAVLFAAVLCMASSPAHASDNTYQAGDIGDEISNIQSRLNSLGFDCGTIDGVFGSKTMNEVKAFQASKGLEPTGIVDAATYSALIGRDMPPISRNASHALARRIIQTAMNYVGVPYHFGGTTPGGFDCSGYTRFVYGQAGVNLPRMADEQYGIGTPVSHHNLQPGDLVFFTTYTSGVSHVGIYMGNGLFISATSSKGVQVNPLNHSYWGPRYIGARKIL